jgi:hypothetical protein
MSKTFSIIFIFIILIAGGVGVWFWRNPKVPEVVEQKVPSKPSTFVVSDFKNYEGNTLPSQFPKNFPNPALAGEVVLSNSMTLNQGLPITQSIYRFNTKIPTEDILKLYKDYFAKNKWVISSTNTNPNSIQARKDLESIGVSVAGSLVTLSISSIDAELTPN